MQQPSPAPSDGAGLFDLTPTEDQQQLVDVVTELARDLVRPAASGADDACAPPPELTAAFGALGLAALGVPERLGGLAEDRAAVTGTLLAEALAHGDMGLAVSLLATGSVATALGMWGSEAQQQTHLGALIGPDAPVAALALTEPSVLFDALAPSTTAVRRTDGLVLTGTKSLVPRGAEAALFVVGAMLADEPVLVLVEATTPGLTVEPEPAMGLRAAGLTRVVLDGVEVPADAILGDTTGEAYTECVRLSRLAWCALAVGTGQAVLDHVTPYVNQRKAFGEPIAHRQAVAFSVADMAIELQAMWENALGVKVQPQKQEWKVYLDSMKKLNYDICRSSWVGDYNDPNTFLEQFTAGNGNNRTGYANADYDAAIAAAGREPDPAKRNAILAAVETRLVYDDAVVSPVYHYVGVQFYFSDEIAGVQANLVDEHPFRCMKRLRPPRL